MWFPVIFQLYCCRCNDDDGNNNSNSNNKQCSRRVVVAFSSFSGGGCREAEAGKWATAHEDSEADS